MSALQYEIVTTEKTHGPMTGEDVPSWVQTLGLRAEDEGEEFGWHVQVVGRFYEQARA